MAHHHHHGHHWGHHNRPWRYSSGWSVPYAYDYPYYFTPDSSYYSPIVLQTDNTQIQSPATKLAEEPPVVVPDKKENNNLIYLAIFILFLLLLLNLFQRNR